MRQTVWTVAILLVCAVGAGAETAWFAEDFENTDALQQTQWQAEPEADCRVGTGPANDWQLLEMEFNSEQYTTIRPYLRLQDGDGTVFFDELRIGDLPISNPGFEQAQGDRLTGWQQTDVGQTVFWQPSAGWGRGCVRITRPTRGTTRLWQDVPCAPHTDYKLQVQACWGYLSPETGKGAPYAEVYGVNPDGSLGKLFGLTRRLPCPPGLQCGRRLLVLQPRKGSATASRPLALPADCELYRLEADVNVEELSGGQLRLAVVDQGSGTELGALIVAGAEAGWNRHTANFLAPADSKLSLVITATAHGGQAYVDNLVVTDYRLTIKPQKMRLLPIAQWMRLKQGQLPKFQMPDSELLTRGAQMLADAIRKKWGDVPVETAASGPPIRVEISGEQEPWPVSESYHLEVGPEGTRIQAVTERGAFWGLMTLLDLFTNTPDMIDGTAAIAGCVIEDWPDLPLRGSLLFSVYDTQERRQWCERFARLKLNTVVIDCADVFFYLDDPDKRRLAEQAFADFRSYGLDPIPCLNSFGHAHAQLAINPNIAEGTWQQDEKITLHGQEPVAVAHPNVIRTPSSDVVVTNQDKSITYQEGRDYIIIPGEMSFPFHEAEHLKIQRTENSRIPEGATVLVSYDWVVPGLGNSYSYCPSEPQTYEIMIPAIQKTIKYLHPKYLHVGHDEISQLNTCSRCQRRNMTDAQLIAEDLHKLNNAAHQADPEVVVMMWADMLNPYNHGQRFQGENERDLDLMPKDIIQCVWIYGAAPVLNTGLLSFELFQKHGFAGVTGSSWYGLDCCRNWGIVAKQARRKGINCLGIWYTCHYNRWEGLETLADAAWHTPNEEAATSID